MLPVAPTTPIRLPQTGGERPKPGGGDGGTADPDTGITLPDFEKAGGDSYVRDIETAVRNIQSGNYSPADVYALKNAGLLTTDEASDLLQGAGTGGSGSGGGSGSAFEGDANARAWNADARAAAGFAADEEQRRINNAIGWQELLNSQKYADRNFAQGQLQDNRTEMGNRANAGFSLGNLLMDISARDDALANDPGNFPAWLTAMQSNDRMGPVVQNLVGDGVSINPQNTGRGIDDPRFNTTLDSLFDYAKVPAGSDVDRVQQAYNTDAEAARRWFETAAAIDKGKGAATGGTFHVGAPTRLQDVRTGRTMGVMGEAGPETVNVQPQQAPQQRDPSTSPGSVEDLAGVSRNDPRIGSAGTFGAIAKAIGASGMYSAIPSWVRARMAQGYAPNPGDVPDWLIAKLPPSLQRLFAAGVTAQLGSAGAEDYDWTRGLYEIKGFGPAGGVAR